MAKTTEMNVVLHAWEAEFKIFLGSLLNPLGRRVNLILVGAFLLLTPPQNAYSHWEIPQSSPVVKEANFSLSSPGEYPVNVTGIELSWLSARSVIVVDVTSKAVVFAKNPDWQLPPASTTKMMTALVALESYPLSDVLTVNDLNGSIGQTMRLEAGEKLTVKSLLYGLLVQSGNDAAQVFAADYPGGETAFVEKMNQKARQLHLDETHFKNPSGVEAYDHLSTVHDLALLGAQVMKQPLLAQIVATEEITITDVTGKIKHPLKNINQLVGVVPGVLGIKTGWTENASECLVTFVERNGHQIIIALLGSGDRFGETKMIIDWVFSNYKWEKISASKIDVAP